MFGYKNRIMDVTRHIFVCFSSFYVAILFARAPPPALPPPRSARPPRWPASSVAVATAGPSGRLVCLSEWRPASGAMRVVDWLGRSRHSNRRNGRPVHARKERGRAACAEGSHSARVKLQRAQLQVLQRVAHLGVPEAEGVHGDKDDGAGANEEDGGFHGGDAVRPAEQPPPCSHRQARRLHCLVALIM